MKFVLGGITKKHDWIIGNEAIEQYTHNVVSKIIEFKK